MKGKLLAFGVSLLAMATIGVVQLQTQAAEPGQVNSAPRCNVDVKGQRDSAFKVSGSRATVDFTVKGVDGCKVQVSGNSFYAPTMDGRPYDQQILFDRKTKVLSKGDHSITVNLPTTSTKQKGCFYQVDLTYGTHNVQPVLAYGHGKIEGCGEQPPKPKAECVSVKVIEQERTKFLVKAKANATGGAKIKSYTLKVFKGDSVLYDNTYQNTTEEQSVVYIVNEPGEYRVKATVETTEGVKKSAACEATFRVTALPPPPPTPTPAVDITKHVDNDKKYIRVNANVEFTYKIDVRNTGSVDLDNVVVTDTPAQGITLLSVTPPSGKIENNIFSYTIPKLLKGETRTFVLTAKVPVSLAGKLLNTVCVDAPAVPGNPDKCDTAEVEVPPTPVPGKIEVCRLADKTIIQINENEFDIAIHSKTLSDCDEVKEEAPAELPQTGPAEAILSVVGAMSLVGASAYYATSRRHV